MKIAILQNSDESFYKAIKESLTWADNVYLGVAYASYAAFHSLKNDLQTFLRNNGRLRALFDIEEFITEKKLIEELATIPGDSECKVFINLDHINNFIGLYHPKFYLFHNKEIYRVIIGSSNFTLGGIKHNIECNLTIHGNQDDLFKTLVSYFNELWTAEYSINVLGHGELLDVYQQAFQKSAKADASKTTKLQALRERVQKTANQIVKLKKDVLNEEFAYLLGLISANSEINWKKRELIIDLQRGIANRGKPYEGYYYNPDISDYKISQYDAHKKDVDRITESINLLIKHLGTRDRLTAQHISGYHFQIKIRFDKNSPIFEEIKNLNIEVSRKKIVPFVPEIILSSKDTKIMTSFIRGYCDLKSRISVSDGIYDTRKQIYSLLRMGISLPHGATKLVKQFLMLLEKIRVKKGVSATDPRQRTRENLIRIDVRNVPYDLVGTHWRRIFLKDFATYMANIRRNRELFG
jgi:HKD family nuclease